MARKRSFSRKRDALPEKEAPAREESEGAPDAEAGEDVSEVVYRRVGREILNGDLHPACWAKALAESEGGHDAALAAYARMRSVELTRLVKGEAEKKKMLACRVARAYREPVEPPQMMHPVSLERPVGVKGAMDAMFWHCVAIVGAVGCLLGAQLIWPGVAAHLTVDRIILIVFAFQLFPVLGWVAAGRNGFYSALSYAQATHLSACVAVAASFGLGAYLLVQSGKIGAPSTPEETPRPLLVVMPEEQIIRPVVHVEETPQKPVRLVSVKDEK